MSFVKNCWYVAAWSKDIEHKLISRTITGENIVFYRTVAGQVVAFLDVCPHRKLPLSKGRLIEDSIECGYHGLTFDCTGRCIRIPGQDSHNSAIKVARKYPIAEKMGMVWIWMGDPDLANSDDIYDLPKYYDPSWSVAYGDAMLYGANYLLVADNLCDPAHVSFVHRSTLGNQSSEDVPIETTSEGNCVITHRWINDSEPIPVFQKFGNFKGKVDRWHCYYFYAPNIAIIDLGSADASTGAHDGQGENRIQIFSCHFLTPVDESHTVDHWLYVKNFRPDNGDVDERISAEFRIAYAEDKDILENCQKEEDAGHTWRPVRLGIDKGSMKMRKIVDEMLSMEAARS